MTIDTRSQWWRTLKTALNTTKRCICCWSFMNQSPASLTVFLLWRITVKLNTCKRNLEMAVAEVRWSVNRATLADAWKKAHIWIEWRNTTMEKSHKRKTFGMNAWICQLETEAKKNNAVASLKKIPVVRIFEIVMRYGRWNLANFLHHDFGQLHNIPAMYASQ